MEEAKLHFANALRSLMNEKPLSKITVVEIAKRAGYSRQAFYSYFKDKQDVLNWILYSQFVRQHGEEFGYGGWRAFAPFLDFFATDPAFFSEALRDMGQNSMGRYFSDILYEIVYATMHDGYANVIKDEKWIQMGIARAIEDSRMAIVIWLSENDAPNPDDLLGYLLAANYASISMLCLDRQMRSGLPECPWARSTVGNWSSIVDPATINIPRPDEPYPRRQQVEWYLSRFS